MGGITGPDPPILPSAAYSQLPITLLSALPSTLFPADLYQKDEREQTGVLQSTKD